VKYTTNKIETTRARITASERRLAAQRARIARTPRDGEMADHAQALLLIMEQSILSMKRFLKILEQDLLQEERARAPAPRSPAPRSRRSSGSGATDGS